MRTLLAFAGALLISVTSLAQDSHMGRDPQDAVTQFFQFFHKQDTTQLRSMMLPKALLQSLMVRDGKEFQSSSSVDEFVQGIASIPKEMDFEERLGKLSVLTDERIATVSVPYEFFVNGKMVHRGTNVFTLLYLDRRYVIASIVDTRIVD